MVNARLCIVIVIDDLFSLAWSLARELVASPRASVIGHIISSFLILTLYSNCWFVGHDGVAFYFPSALGGSKIFPDIKAP